MPTFRDCSASQDAIYKRYGKQVTITGKFEANADKTYNWVCMDFISQKGGKYSLIETFNRNATDTVKLIHPKGELVYKRYIDAEVAMIDKISEE